MRSPYEAIPESAWEVYEITDDYIRSRAYLDAERTTCVERTQYLADQLLQKANAAEFADSDGKRWGDGKVVARVPLNKYFAEIAAYDREGDRDFMTWWLNHEDNRTFRTFKGRV